VGEQLTAWSVDGGWEVANVGGFMKDAVLVILRREAITN
jgi:hypothetical protein